MHEHPSIALSLIPSYEAADLNTKIKSALDAASMALSRNAKILVKPNLLLPVPLACSHPLVVGAVCEWLLDLGCHPIISDSPGFGSVGHVAAKTGLADVATRIGVPIAPMDRPESIPLELPEFEKTVNLKISRRIWECDAIFSVCKVKAHSQMRATLSVKNCFGCIPGARKAIIHAFYGQTTDFFASCVAAMFLALPPVFACADGILAMSGTGPSKGSPFSLKLFGASRSAPALDAALLEILKIDPETVPLSVALKRRGICFEANRLDYPCEKPDAFNGEGFTTPATLAPASFNPWRLAKSMARRFWQGRLKK